MVLIPKTNHNQIRAMTQKEKTNTDEEDRNEDEQEEYDFGGDLDVVIRSHLENEEDPDDIKDEMWERIVQMDSFYNT